MGGRKIKDLKARMGWECCISRGVRLNSGCIQARGVRGESRSVNRYAISRRSIDAAERAALGVRAVKSSESRKGE